MTDYSLKYEVTRVATEMSKVAKSLVSLNETIREEGRLNRLVTLIAAGVDPDQLDFMKVKNV